MDHPIVHNALGSATASIISRICTHPLDTAKAQMQAGSAQSARIRNPLDAIIQTYAREGIRGWYRGFGAIVVGGTPGTIFYLCGYDWFKHKLSGQMYGKEKQNDRASDFAVHFLSGMLAETVACLVYVPVDVIKERLQVQGLSTNNPTSYTGSFDAFRKIMRMEGLRGIYKGYGATLASFGPFSAFYFVFYEELKQLARHRDPTYVRQLADGGDKAKPDGDLSFPLLVACSCGAGAVASFITSPLDMAKLRLQIQRGQITTETSNAQSYRSMIHCLTTVYQQFGVRGLFRGAGARVLHFAPATTITMTCYEKCRAFYARKLSSSDK